MTAVDMPSDGRILPAILTIGFATAVPMWVVGFLTHLPGMELDPSIIGVLLLATLGAGVGFAGRGQRLGAAIRRGLGAGLIAGLINLLVLGSALTDGQGAPPPGTPAATEGSAGPAPATEDATFRPNAIRPDAPIWIGGSLLLSAVVGVGAAGAVSMATSRRPRHADTQTWLSRFAMVAAVSTLPVLFSGGLVTSHDVGLAVPDWPNSYGANMFLFPLSQMTGGIFYEHTHRLFGTLVGLTSLTLLALTFIYDRRVIARVMASGAFALVVAQGLLGGARVFMADEATIPSAAGDNALSVFLRIVHGVSGQVTFATLCVAAAVFSLSWRRSEEKRPDGLLRSSSVALLICLLLQLILGAGKRHMGDAGGGFLHGHMTLSVIVVVVALFTGARARGMHRDDRIIRTLGTACLHTVLLQFVLGWVTFWALEVQDGSGALDLVTRTGHHAIGAALFAFAALLFAWTRKRVGPGKATLPAEPAAA